MSHLGDCLSEYGVITLIGMSKNAGKTTVLNHLLEHCKKNNLTAALTSIGRDGEDVDIVTGTRKPKIYVPRGCIIATAQALLGLSDITSEILDVTDFNTPMGRIILARAISAGFVQVGGPSISCHLSEILKSLKTYHVDKVLIDGAISRKSTSSPLLAQAVVLCAGASLASDMGDVILRTKFAARMLSIPKAASEAEHTYITGAVTDAKIKSLLHSGENLSGVQIGCEDPSKILISQGAYEKLMARGASLVVKNPANLAAITVNPLSVRGYSFSKDEFLQRMAEAVNVPVFDVCRSF